VEAVATARGCVQPGHFRFLKRECFAVLSPSLCSECYIQSSRHLDRLALPKGRLTPMKAIAYFVHGVLLLANPLAAQQAPALDIALLQRALAANPQGAMDRNFKAPAAALTEVGRGNGVSGNPGGVQSEALRKGDGRDLGRPRRVGGGPLEGGTERKKIPSTALATSGLPYKNGLSRLGRRRSPLKFDRFSRQREPLSASLPRPRH